jgi:hypothetical protein
MAINFVQGQVAVGDPNAPYPSPSPTSNIKEVHTKVIKLTSANFGTTAVNTLVAVLAADATILSVSLWNKTILSGNSISAATISMGNVSAGTQFISVYNAFSASGTYGVVTPITGIMQNYGVPLGTDIPIWISGTATTGIPTAGEMYLMIEYCR